ncbi:MAG: CARDB domain-containing protein, partial [Anaerolineae bacterium]
PPQVTQGKLVEVQGEGQERELVHGAVRGLVTRGDGSATPPQVTQGKLVEVQDEGQERELVPDNGVGRIVIGDTSPTPPRIVLGQDRGKLLGSPDLIVYDIWSESTPLTAGEWENITFEIYNQGSSGTSATFYTKMWFDGYDIGTWYTNGLGAGYYTIGSIDVKTTYGGYHTVRVETDTTGAVSESNEGNNSRSETWNWAGGNVDLIVYDIWSNTTPLTAGEWEDITFQIRNQGSASTATTFYTKMWFDGQEIWTWYTNGLSAGYAATGSVNVRANNAGTHTIQVDTDTTNAVSESDESNNSRSETWTWSTTGVDLAVEDIWSTTTPLAVDQWENITFSIKNFGSEPTRSQDSVLPDSKVAQFGDQLDDLKLAVDPDTGVPSHVAGRIDLHRRDGESVEDLAMRFFKTYGALFDMQNPVDELTLIRSKVDSLGWSHVKFQQVKDGVEVFGAQLIVHINDAGEVKSVNGTYVPNIEVSVEPTIGFDEAVQAARLNLGDPLATPVEHGRIVITTETGQPSLAWMFSILSPNLGGSWVYFVDAHSGSVLWMYSEIKIARNRETYAANGGDVLPGTLIITETTQSHPDNIAWTTHENTGRVYDYYWNTHQRDSYDDAGATLRSTVHAGGPRVCGTGCPQACWTGAQMVYCDGDGQNYDAFGLALDIVAHELTHAITDREIPNWPYEGQRGALNESFSDVFGAMVDRDDWLIGETITQSAQAQWRSMSDPHAGNPWQPAHMSEIRTYWGPCGWWNDNCGVHINSGIPNKAAYNIATSIGRDKTERIYYLALTNYLTNNSDFADARRGILDACNQLYGENSTECTKVGEGFDAVGIYGAGAFFTRMWIDSQEIHTWYTNGLGAGERQYGSIEVQVHSAGNHTVRVEVDHTRVIAETNESNNVRSEIWTWFVSPVP